MASKSENRSVSDFSRIELKYLGEMRITQGEASSLTIEADEDVLAKLTSEVRGDTLVLEMAGDWLERIFGGFLSLGRSNIVYHITVKTLSNLKIAGQGKVSMPSLETDRLELVTAGLSNITIPSLRAGALDVNISGRGEVALQGQVEEQRVVISGSGDYRAETLSSNKASVRISGHGNVVLAASKTLDVVISGYGKVDYKGSPVVSKVVSGSGHVQQIA